MTSTTTTSNSKNPTTTTTTDSSITSPSADFDDFLLKRLHQEEEDELELLLQDDDDDVVRKYSSTGKKNDSTTEQRDEELHDGEELNVSEAKENQDESEREDSHSLEQQKSQNISPTADDSQNSNDSQVSTDASSPESQNTQRQRTDSTISSQGDTVTLSWDPNDDQMDQNDTSFKNFHNRLLSVLQYNGASLNVDKLKQITSAVVSNTARDADHMKPEREQSSDTPSPAPSTSTDDVSNIVETRLSLFISNVLNQFGKVITIPNPDDLLKRQEEALTSVPQFDTINLSLQRKLILLECTVDNMADTLADCVRKNVRLGRQRTLLKQNAKDLKLHFLQQQKEIQNKDQEIRYLHEKISKLNQLATKYKTRLEGHGDTEHEDEDLHLLASTEAQPTAGAKLVSSLMSWIGKKEGGGQEIGETGKSGEESLQGSGSNKTGEENRTTWGSWFSKKSS
eukprot:CAMPEP_0117441336 /NCGR_PEP_ID=MMETSP0759-20121206/3582_1 /TAXON_ID=63605 /ORGANISM="Percolomonas cosmopolitus, Strain WS" /LENGTH=453 /DNA_ID=CAMNT_0005233187 /DNA_START=5 /DNA_END=1366 /DNA_ORIENTATION=+